MKVWVNCTLKPTCYVGKYVTKLIFLWPYLLYQHSVIVCTTYILRKKEWNSRSAFLFHHKRLIKEFSQVCVHTLQWRRSIIKVGGNWSHHLSIITKYVVLLESFVYLSLFFVVCTIIDQSFHLLSKVWFVKSRLTVLVISIYRTRSNTRRVFYFSKKVFGWVFQKHFILSITFL